jgi:hypothetical protein
VHIRGRGSVHLTRLKDDPWARRISQLARLSQQRPQLIADIKVTQVVDTEMAVDAIKVEAILIRVDASRQDQEVETVERLAKPGKDLSDLRQVSHVALPPLNLRAGRLLLDCPDGVGALDLLAVHHDDLASCVGEGAADFEADSQRSAGDDGDAALEVFWVDGSRTDSCCFLEEGLHCVLCLMAGGAYSVNCDVDDGGYRRRCDL